MAVPSPHGLWLIQIGCSAPPTVLLDCDSGEPLKSLPLRACRT
jgi:hypothetical protein